MAEIGGVLGGASIVHAGGQEGTDDAAAVHGEGGEHVEDDEGDIDDQEAFGEGGVGDVDGGDVEAWASDGKPGPKAGGDDDVDGGACEGDPQFLPGVVGHSFESGDAADGEEGDVFGEDAVPSGGEGMAKFMEDDAAEEGEHEGCVSEDDLLAFTGDEAGDDDPGEEDQEGEMHLDADARECTEL